MLITLVETNIQIKYEADIRLISSAMFISSLCLEYIIGYHPSVLSWHRVLKEYEHVLGSIYEIRLVC